MSMIRPNGMTYDACPTREPRVDASVDIAERARTMHAAGHGLHDVASVLGVHPEQVRRWLATVDDEAAAVHARAWAQP